MSLQTIEATFVAAAKAEWAKIAAEGIAIAQEIESSAVTTFESLSTQFAPLIMSTISNLATAEFSGLSGSEKTNLAATTVVDKAAQQGIAILAADATALIKNGFEAFKAAAPALGAPAEISAAANLAIDAGEAKVEAAVEGAAEAVGAKVAPPEAG